MGIDCQVLGEYGEEGALHHRPYFRKQNTTATFFMFFSGKSWLISDVLDKKTATLRHLNVNSDLRESGMTRLLQKVINGIRVKERSCQMLKSG